jgi:dTDP-4-amino-4,6-dideoxygalactose transaminase
MTTSELAVNGGRKTRTYNFPSQNTYGAEEMSAVTWVMRTGRLSWYRGNWGTAFYGGPEIQALEAEWQGRWNVRHAICCNSATSGLFIALAALGIGSGDHVIVSPYSMTCSATLPLAFGATPEFVDIEEDCFCVEYEAIERLLHFRRIQPKAIVAVSLFGQPFDPRLREFNIPIIEDAAQALGSAWVDDERKRSVYAGTLGDIGVYSFNYGKHLTCGEGGMVVTDSDELAMKCRLIMNHGESVLNDIDDASKIPYGVPPFFGPGFNLRMTELHAAIIREQLKKFPLLLAQRIRNAAYLSERLSTIPAITPAPVREECSHTYYALPYLWDSGKASGLHRDVFIDAVKAELMPREDRDTEGIQIGCGYIKPIYKMPIFNKDLRLPNVESLWRDRLFLTLLHAPQSSLEDIEDVAKAFHKVWNHREELK